MAFPPQFLDDLRARVPLAELIGRRVRLVRKGREHVGLCPFHSEKTPSFTVSEDKGFFHCFGCGAHGDAIGFVMRGDGLSFPEAVERLALDAGIDMPRPTPEERATAKRAASHHELLEKACAFYQAQLDTAAGRPAADYLRRRGLTDRTIARFRIGYAPASRDALRSALAGAQAPEALLVEAGLLVRPEGGGAPYDRFRRRVMFPIADRRGRVIAFGGRLLGDGRPKYLNSPDTPLFDKGRVLYGLATARRPAHERGRVIVTEGYMDVIALAQADFPEAVAPLGTALTESQLHELWRLAAEPLLCFDGDEAGRRAAARAAERALPLLQPGRSLRFVVLPAGEDPDGLIASGGPAAMAARLQAAQPLDELIWEIETASRALDTPERIADLERRLEARAARIADRKVQFRYRERFRRRLRETVWPSAARGRPGPAVGSGARGGTAILRKRGEQALIATLVNHPPLLHDVVERLAGIELAESDLDKLREGLLLLSADGSDLDSGGIERQLRERGFSDALDGLLGAELYVHAGFARPGAPLDVARAGLEQVVRQLTAPSRRAEIETARQVFVEDPTGENWARFESLKTQDQVDLRDRDALGGDAGADALG